MQLPGLGDRQGLEFIMKGALCSCPVYREIQTEGSLPTQNRWALPHLNPAEPLFSKPILQSFRI